MLFHRHLWRSLAGAVALAVATLALTLSATPAQAYCGETNIQHAKRTRSAHGAAPLVVGDSTLLIAADKLAARGISADAMGCRAFDAGLAILSARRHAHDLPRLAVLALGSNGTVSGTQIGRALAITGPKRVLGLVTPVNNASAAAAMKRAARRHPKRVLLIDWARRSAGHGSWFIDGLHPSYPGAGAFAHLIEQRLRPTATKLRLTR
jgi:lysophospholipase L1-like esterase